MSDRTHHTTRTADRHDGVTGSSRRSVTRAAAATALAALVGSAGATTAAAADRRTAAPGARSVTRLGPRTLDLSLPSAALGGNAPVRLILPSSFDARPARTYPVLYLLHGAHDDYTSWTRETDVEAFTAGRELIVAMPDAGPTGIPTAWREGPDYETFQVSEVPALLARDYRASGVRVVAGVSTGGYGAMAHAARHPGTFRAAASYSGILDTTAPGVPSLMDAIVSRENLDPRSLWGHPVLNLLTWRDFNPRSRAAGLRGTALYVSSGSGVVGGLGDWLPEALESLLWPSAHAFTDALAVLRVPVTTHFYAGGGHGWAYWKREFAASWPMLAGALGVPA
ncbi:MULTISPECIES: alpha/beta hydrolase [Streptomyces]|uniref:Acyl-CoA:diacylglycerol acyltransferase n=1 Tax=Streptomyces stelliscabiei TaxID=146820 RepID=A0A8I0TP84_9ACTN|nr:MULTISPECIES: alpha/beta hydrolase family protein [Streptomyces]KND45978.1 esterase [Streptomyces stelliscabiei]MBE1595324.1 S-formylglutathione hydrolase FrmB [Streptomyces stelliscabiei]MDX2516277.1 alpha/beta hydrolase family protein [Streptomyces stelliscabiei]MDX2557870.1 alpha/beta hydrolase family protein [Streptomyces stelliscabiei]MDX2612236.1 alpha/beta hydrolase family protein [Streptomyces stelliscabiei]